MELWVPTSRGIEAAAVLAALWTAESVWPMYRGREGRGRHYANNIALGAINALVSTALFATLLLFVTRIAAENNFGVLRWLELRGAIAWVSALLLFDAWQYVWHRMNHTFRILWRLHAVHHSDGELDASSALRFHLGEVALSSVARLVVLPVLGMELIHLAIYESILFPVIMLHHSNVRMPPMLDRLLRAVIVTPRMHWVHHSTLRLETDSNYSSIFSVWDRLFRTYRHRANPLDIRFGLDGFDESEWKGVLPPLKIPVTHPFGVRTGDGLCKPDSDSGSRS